MRHVNCKAKTNARVSNFNVYTPNGVYNLLDQGFQEYTELIPSFYVEKLMQKEACFTVRKEYRAGTAHWYASKRFAGKLTKVYVGQWITFEALMKAAEKLPTELWTDPKFR